MHLLPLPFRALFSTAAKISTPAKNCFTSLSMIDAFVKPIAYATHSTCTFTEAESNIY
jgi:hypothetical protein